jgi:hypothetical protein
VSHWAAICLPLHDHSSISRKNCELTWESSLDLGWAKIYGLDDYLGVNDDQWEWVIVSYDLCWLLFQWSVIVLNWLPPRTLLLFAGTSFTVLSVLLSLTTNFAILCVLRGLLGATQGCLAGVIPLYISLLYRQQELAVRNALYLSGSILATPAAPWVSMLAWKLSSMLPLEDLDDQWRSLFVFQSVIGGLVAVWAWKRIPRSPLRAHYFSQDEEEIALIRLSEFQGVRNSSSDYCPDHKARSIFQNYLIHVLIAIFCLNNLTFAPMTVFLRIDQTMLYSFTPVYLPASIYRLGYGAWISQLLCAPPYIGALLMVLWVARMSDREGGPSMHLISISASISAIGFAPMIFLRNESLATWIRYLCMIPTAMGFYCVMMLVTTAALTLSRNKFGRTLSLALVQGIGQWIPSFGGRLYPPELYPLYVKGMVVATCAAFSIALLSAILGCHSRDKAEHLEDSHGRLSRET